MSYVFGSVANVFSSIDPFLIMERVFSNNEIKELLIEVVQSRLEFDGQTASGVKLETDKAILQNEGFVYSINNPKHLTHKIVDLNDTNDFYKSFNVDENKTGFDMSAEFKKPTNEISDNFTALFSKEDFETEILTPIIDKYFINFTIEEVKPVFVEVLTEYFTDGLKEIK